MYVCPQLGTVVVFFFVCLLPFRLFTLWVILTPDEIMKNMSIETYYHVLLLKIKSFKLIKIMKLI